MNIVIKKPLISEKTMKMAGQGWYTFIVSPEARKPEILKAIEEQFNVKVVAVKTANFKEEKKSQRRVRGFFTIPAYKKAIVTLKKGQKIGLFEVEKTPEEETKEEVKEKKSLLRGTKVKIEKTGKEEKVEKTQKKGKNG